MSAFPVSSGKAFDLVTWGETMIRLSPPPGVPLEGATSLEMMVGGTESNVAIALARLGLRTAWVSRLPEHALGRRIASDIAAQGVDVSRVLWADPEEKAGLYFIEPGAAPRPNRVIYERAGSAVSRLTPGDLDYGFLASGSILHLTGITPALGPGCREAWLRSAREARQNGSEVSLDVNYRAKLWTHEEARNTMESILPDVDLLFCGLGDLQSLFGMPEDPALAARTFSEAHGVPLVVLTLGDAGALAWERESETLETHPVFHTEVADRIGAGDAFAAGFLLGRQEGGIAHGLRCGNALAALKQTWRRDASWAAREDLRELMEGDAGSVRKVLR